MNGIEVTSICTSSPKLFGDTHLVTDDYKQMLNEVDAVYVVSPPKQHYQDIKTALEYKKHILCESPITVSKSECTELFKQILGMIRNKKILKSRRFARNFACNRPDFMCELSEKVPPKQN